MKASGEDKPSREWLETHPSYLFPILALWRGGIIGIKNDRGQLLGRIAVPEFHGDRGEQAVGVIIKAPQLPDHHGL